LRFSQLVLRNLRRTPLRTLMTVMTVAIMLAAFVFPRSVVDAQDEQIRQTPNNRVVTRSKLGWGQPMPLSYADSIRQLPGVVLAVGSRPAGFRLPGKDNVFFRSWGTEPVPLLAMHDEIVLPPEQKQAWLDNERGVLVSRDLAEEQGWKLGDRVIFEGSFLPGKWEVNVSGIFRSTREGFGERTVWVHYSFFNRALPPGDQDKLSLIAAEIREPNQGGRIAAEIDTQFADTQFETLSVEDQVLIASLIGRFRAILDALDAVSYLILVVILTMVSNTLAINVRERTREYGVMRAIGFSPRALVGLVLAEGALLGLAGAVVGLAISYPLFEGLVSRILRDALQFPPIEISWRVASAAVLLGAGTAMLSAGLPAYRAGRLGLTEALRRVV
jgi:putative ABC transport system permease protein